MSRRNKQVQTMDAFSNPMFRLGYGSQSPLEATQYPMTRMTQNYALLNSLYRDNWIVQNIITTIPDDMLREWVKLDGLTPEAQDQIDRAVRRTSLRDRLSKGLYWGRLYGGAVGVILIRGQEDLAQPLDLDAVLPGTFLGLYVVDRWSGVYPDMELVTDMADPDFGLPAYYSVQDANGGTVQRVHHSRVVRFTGRELPYLEKIAETYWGASELEAIYDEIVKRDNVSHNLAALTFKACRDYMEVDNVDQILSIGSPAMQKRLYDTLQAQSVLDTNFGMRIVNKGDGIHNTQYTFSGLADVYNTVMMDVSGAARIPVTKLFGRSPAGLNATGESDLQNYYDYIDTKRESDLRPILERLLPVLCLSCWGQVPDGIGITFPPLWTPKATEVADIVDKKSGSVLAAYQGGLIDKGTAQKELKKMSDDTGMFDSIPDEQIQQNAGVTYQDTQAMRDPLAALTMGAMPTADGGAGSGNFSHAGRPGQVGGSGGGGGLTNGAQSGNLQSSQMPEWSSKQAKEPFDYWELSADKTGFPRRWVAKDFSPSARAQHFKDHGASVEAASEEGYVEKARAFLASPRGKHGVAFVRSNGDVCRYDYEGGLYAVATSSGTIKTFWNLNADRGNRNAVRYWERDKLDNGK